MGNPLAKHRLYLILPYLLGVLMVMIFFFSIFAELVKLKSLVVVNQQQQRRCWTSSKNPMFCHGMLKIVDLDAILLTFHSVCVSHFDFWCTYLLTVFSALPHTQMVVAIERADIDRLAQGRHDRRYHSESFLYDRYTPFICVVVPLLVSLYTLS